MERRHIVRFGDPNIHGYRVSDDGRYGEQERWTCLLQEQLGDDYLIIEEGLPGQTTCFSDSIHEGLSGSDYIYPCLMSHELVDLLVTVSGTNDAKERLGVPAVCIVLGLKRLTVKTASAFDTWRTDRANILVVTPKSIDKRCEATQAGKTMGMGCAEKSEGLARELEGAASQMGCHYLDASTMVTERNHYDLMYLTKGGRQELADALAEVISSSFNSQ